MKEISIYHTHEFFTPLTESIDIKDLVDPAKAEHPMKNYYLQILYSIYKYKAVNKTGIENCLNFKKKNSWKRKSLRKALRALRAYHYIRAYGTKEFPSGESYAVVVYVLTKKGGLLLESNKRTIDYERIYKEESLKPTTILRQASIAQYHISLVKNYGYLFKESLFDKYKSKADVVADSMVDFYKYHSKLQLYSNATHLRIYGFAAPKTEEEIEPFFEKLLLFINGEVEEAEIIKLIIIVCESTTYAGYLAWKLNQYRQMRPFPVLYIQDMVTATEDPLSNVIECNTDEEGVIHSNINFFKV